MATTLQVAAQFSGIVGFTVISDPNAAIFIGHGLGTAFAKIYDG
jgi:hypothetical protein